MLTEQLQLYAPPGVILYLTSLHQDGDCAQHSLKHKLHHTCGCVDRTRIPKTAKEGRKARKREWRVVSDTDSLLRYSLTHRTGEWKDETEERGVAKYRPWCRFSLSDNLALAVWVNYVTLMTQNIKQWTTKKNKICQHQDAVNTITLKCKEILFICIILGWAIHKLLKGWQSCKEEKSTANDVEIKFV